MYPRNSVSPPPLFSQLVNKDTGAGITTAVAAKYSTGTGSQSAGGGTLSHQGNGQWAYTPTQAETNVSSFGVQFYHADAVGGGPTISVVTTADVAQTGDTYAVVTNATYGLDKLARTGAENDTLKTLSDQIDLTALDATVFKTDGYTAPPTVGAIADAVCDEALSGHGTPGTVGAALTAAGNAGDPWSGELPGDYEEGQAGYMMGNIYERIQEQVPDDDPFVPISAPDPTATVAYAYCYDAAGLPTAGVTLTIRLMSADGEGAAYSGRIVTAVSDANGLAQVSIPRGDHLTFFARRGGGSWTKFAGVDAATVQITDIVGRTNEVLRQD